MDVRGFHRVAVLLVGLAVQAAPPEAPDNLRVCDAVNPVGTGGAPFFGWLVRDPDSNEIQSAYQIQVSTDASFSGPLAWDSGKVFERLQNHIVYAGSPLGSDTKYSWRVRTWDRGGSEGAWSEPSEFTVGLLHNRDWKGANWIRRDSSDADDYTYYRNVAALPAGTIERATVYISGVHKYALYLNGEIVGKGPAYHYPQYQYYNAFDITDLLCAGSDNQFAVFNHWFGGGQGRPASARGIIMKAVIHYADGSALEVNTDGSWRQSRAEAWVLGQPHRNRSEGVGYIEKIDARKLISDWCAADFDDASWEFATVIGPHPVAPWTGTLAPDLTRIMEHTIAPVFITDLRNGSWMVDFGKVVAGVPRIRFSGGQSGDLVTMLGGYALDASGRIDSSKNQSTDLHCFAVLNGGEFVFEPAEYFGARYLQIDNAPMEITAETVEFVVRHSELDESASAFESSDETLNAVWELMKHSLIPCAQEEFVDTPTREKGGFLGDAAIQSTVAMPVMNERLLTQRVMNEFLQSMDQYWSGEGRLNAVYPNNDGGRDIPDFTQSYLVWVWMGYLETGDQDFLSKNYEKLKSVAEYVYRHRDPETGLIRNLTGGKSAYEFGIVDWPATMRFGYDMTTARTVINGWAYADYRAMSNIAKVLGRSSDSRVWKERSDALEEAMNSQLVNGDGLYVDGLNAAGEQSAHVSQHANMFPLALGIVSRDRKAVVVDLIKQKKLSVGMVTLPWLIRAAGEADEGAYLLELFTNEEWNGWANCLSRGAAATWESWDADTTGQSMSHAWGAAGLEGVVRYILGIRPLRPQYEKVLIKPLDFGERLTRAGGFIATDRGRIAVEWCCEPGRSYELDVELPVNVTADIVLPSGSIADPVITMDGQPVVLNDGFQTLENIGSGHHKILCTVGEPEE